MNVKKICQYTFVSTKTFSTVLKRFQHSQITLKGNSTTAVFLREAYSLQDEIESNLLQLEEFIKEKIPEESTNLPQLRNLINKQGRLLTSLSYEIKELTLAWKDKELDWIKKENEWIKKETALIHEKNQLTKALNRKDIESALALKRKELDWTLAFKDKDLELSLALNEKEKEFLKKENELSTMKRVIL